MNTARGYRAGGYLDPALFDAYRATLQTINRPDAPVTQETWATHVHWTGDRTLLAFSNTALYPPLFYAPAAVAVLLGRATRMTVTRTLILSRLLTGATAVGIAAAAIACAGDAAVWLFAVLTLRTSLTVFASTSQDPLILACSAIAGALLARMLRPSGDAKGWQLGGLTLALALVATARPAYAALAVLPLAPTGLRLRSRLLAAAAVAASVLAWSGIAASTALTNVGIQGGADPAAQIARLQADPLLIARATWAALAHDWARYVQELVGRTSWSGWPEGVLPHVYFTAAQAIIVAAAVAAMSGLRADRVNTGSRLAIAAGLLLSAAGVFAIEYVTFNVPGSATVEGVSGRYFLPLLLIAASLFPASGGKRFARPRVALVLAVAAFPLVSITVATDAVVLQYYFR